jgi:glutathione S-transferase
MKLYSAPLSLFARKVEIALGEKGLPYERVMVPFTQEVGYQPKHPDVLEANPKGQVPVLVDGDLTLFDSTLIFEYLEDAYPRPPLYPVGAVPRARCRLTELAADEILLPLVRALMFRNAPPAPDPARQAQLVAEAERAEAAIQDYYAKLETRLAGREYFCDVFTVADIAMFMTVLFVLRLRGPRLDAFPALAAWHALVGARPAAAKAAAEIAAADRELSPLGRAPSPQTELRGAR